MRFAQNLRLFLKELIGSRYITLLEKELAEMRAEREYFRLKADRLEMMLLSRIYPAPMTAPYPASGWKDIPARRKTLSELQAEMNAAEAKKDGVQDERRQA